MKIKSTDQEIAQLQADAVVVGIYSDSQDPLSGPAARLDGALDGLLAKLVASEDVSGKSGSTSTLHGLAGVAAGRVVTVGLGKRSEFGCKACYQAAGGASKSLAAQPREEVGFYLEDELADDHLEAAVVGAMVGCTGQDLYRKEKSRHPIAEVLFPGSDTVIAQAAMVGESVNFTRLLVNEPPSSIYPVTFAEACQEMAKEVGLQIDVWDEKKLEQERCGSLLAVARGSVNPPRLVTLKHQGGGSDAPTLALVGKGVTFDSGGLSLKPSEGMTAMKCDMAGAGTVVGAMRAIALLNLPVNVIGLVGLVENMPSANCYKLGDVLTARNGKTIEVLNTDAEGRLVLADVLDVAISEGATKIIDLATLTGACVVALGLDIAGLMTNDQDWCDQVAAASGACGEDAWQLPMFEEFSQQIKSEIADIKNIGEGRWGGAITAGKFLEEFVGETPWIHIDIAGPAFGDKEKPWRVSGASGLFVRTLLEVARKWEG